MRNYYENLKAIVEEESGGVPFHVAVRKWGMKKVEEDPYKEGVCVCTKTGLRWLYTIQNEETGKVLFPVGSKCIEHFMSPDMNRKKMMIEVWGEERKIQKGVHKGKTFRELYESREADGFYNFLTTKSTTERKTFVDWIEYYETMNTLCPPDPKKMGNEIIQTGAYKGKTYAEMLKIPNIRGYYNCLKTTYPPKHESLVKWLKYYEAMTTSS